MMKDEILPHNHDEVDQALSLVDDQLVVVVVESHFSPSTNNMMMNNDGISLSVTWCFGQEILYGE